MIPVLRSFVIATMASSTNGPGTREHQAAVVVAGNTRCGFKRAHAANSWYSKTYHSKSVQPPGAKHLRPPGLRVPRARRRDRAGGPTAPAPVRPRRDRLAGPA